MSERGSTKKVLHDPIRPKNRAADIEFAAPTKERATTGSFMPAGDVYGVGYRNPVGHSGKPKGILKGPMPHGCVCFRSDEAIH